MQERSIYGIAHLQGMFVAHLINVSIVLLQTNDSKLFRLVEFLRSNWLSLAKLIEIVKLIEIRPVKDRLEPKRSDRQVFEEMFLIESENQKSRKTRYPEGKNEPERIICKYLTINSMKY